MNEILNKISPNTIDFYIEKNLDDFYTKSSNHPNSISHIDDKISWISSKNADWPDSIFKANFENLNVKKEIINVKKLIQERKAPNGWTVGPLTNPKNLGSLLEKYGFSNDYQQAGMAVELENLMNIKISKSDLVVNKVENEETLKLWCRIVSQVFSIKVDYDLIKFLHLQEEAHFYLGNLKGTPVSTLMLYLSSGVAGLHAVSTLSEYRSKGYGLTISRKALIDAFNMDYHIGVLQASALGERVYRKLGFQKYCDIISYALNIDEKK